MKQVIIKFNAVAAVVLAFILCLLVGYLALSNRVRWDLSDRKYYKLSEKTQYLLERLDQEDQDVLITVFFPQEYKLYDHIENLLEEYEYRSRRHIDIEWVDPSRDVAKAKRLGNKYGVTPSQVLVVEIAGKIKVLREADLAAKQAVQGRKEPVLAAFTGEQAISGAIQALFEGDTPAVYFLAGHGEHRLSDYDQLVGYSDITSIVLRDNISPKELVLNGETGVPADAAAVVIPGPTQKMSQTEVEILEDYLSRGGRLLVLVDALKETGLEGMLRRWGIALRNDIVVDPESTLRGSDVHVRRYNTHPICMKMNAIVQFILPRSIEPPLDDQGNPVWINDLQTVVPLFYTSEKGWSETNLGISPSKFDVNSGDRMGPIDLGVAIERGAAQNELDVQIEPSRMVVIGDSDFVSNGAMVGGNADLFMSSLNWLLDRDQAMNIAPKPIDEVKLGLTIRQIRTLVWLNLAGIPGIAVILGFIVWSRRRK